MSTAPRPVAVITGAGGGVGLACARRLAQTHALVLADARQAGLEQAQHELAALGASPAAARCDVSDAAQVAALARLTQQTGSFHLLLHTAGISRSMAEGPRILEVNLRGTALVLDALLPLAREGSVAVCLSSIGAHRREVFELDELLDPAAPDFPGALEARLPLAGRSGAAYDLSKRGVVLLCERRAAAWGARGARLVSLSPGPIDTEMGRIEGLRDARGLERLAALRRVAQPEEIASAALMLCGQDARYVTGCDLRVDGGTLAGIRRHSPASTAEAWERLRQEA
ncbi:MAG: SDR family NAD(P)-dependent oxidoreductase [Solirubrobacteraceae bacterium]